LDQYVGGVEHATMHLIYARFWTKVLYDLKLVPVQEPFPRLFTQGMVTMHSPVENKVLKMSKSKGNVVSLDEAVERFGADATRMMTLFMGPPAQDVEWKKGESDSTFAGTFRFLERAWRACTAQEFDSNWRQSDFANLSGADTKLRRKTHQTIQKVANDIERFNMNTAISGLMEQVNALTEWNNGSNTNAAVYSEAVENLLLCLSPFAPHIADELGEKLGFTQSFYQAQWPQFDPAIAKEDEIVIPVQVNGKLRTRLTVAADVSPKDVEALALQNAEVQPHLEGKTPKKIIVVPGRLVNIVV
jgi:leucyl-tRNA synthetase